VSPAAITESGTTLTSCACKNVEKKVAMRIICIFFAEIVY